MKRKPNFSAASYHPTAADTFPIKDLLAEPQTTENAASASSPEAISREEAFRQQIYEKWRSGEYRIPDDCDGFMMGTTVILYPRKSDDPKEQMIQQLNYNNFINTMAEMILKYAPQIQKLRERSQ